MEGVIGLSDERQPSQGGARAFDIAGGIMGLLVFLVGIFMVVMVFTWVRGVFEGVDDQVQEVRTAREMAAAQAEETAETDNGEPVVATPHQGPTIADVGITVGLKMLGLLVLGWLGALVASKGAQLAGAHRGKRE